MDRKKDNSIFQIEKEIGKKRLEDIFGKFKGKYPTKDNNRRDAQRALFKKLNKRRRYEAKQGAIRDIEAKRRYYNKKASRQDLGMLRALEHERRKQLARKAALKNLLSDE